MKKKARGLNLPVNDKEDGGRKMHLSHGTMRLQLYMARCGVASRRASEAIIAAGRVTVNGAAVTEPGTKVSLSDSVCVDGNEIFLEEKLRYVLLNKPSGYVCSASDEKGRQVPSDLLKEAYRERLYSIGRLDMFSSGLIIFTNDGNFAAKLSHPSAELEKEYIVDTSVPLPRSLADDFMDGIRIDGIFYRCKDARELNARRMRIVLEEGKNREIRRVFEAYEVGIKSLMRVRIGCIGVGSLQYGQFRDLTQAEISALKRLCRN